MVMKGQKDSDHVVCVRGRFAHDDARSVFHEGLGVIHHRLPLSRDAEWANRHFHILYTRGEFAK